MLSPGILLDDLRSTCFSPIDLPAGGAPQIGMEAEAIVVDAATRRPFPLEPTLSPRATVPAVQRLAEIYGWEPRPTASAGVPEFRLPDGGRITFEPGGQIEYSSAPRGSASEVLSSTRDVFTLLGRALKEVGGDLVFAGLDPVNEIEDTALQLRGERYVRMDRHFWRSGPFGARMMRQSASLQFALDWGPPAGRAARWALLNALVPYLAAIFANAPHYAGRATGHHSYRRVVWDTLDPLRTGMRDAGPQAEGEYLAFALAAPAILIPGGERPCAPFGRWLETGCVTMEDWHTHLSTLFPEVRPRGYLEVRTVDALPPEWYAAPMALLLGLTYDERSAEDARDLLGNPDPSLLALAGRDGVSDTRIGDVARDLWRLALRGCARLGTTAISPEDVETASEFAARYTGAGRTPADDVLARADIFASAAG